MKTANEYLKEAKEASQNELGVISWEFIAGYLSGLCVSMYDAGYNDGFETSQTAERGIKEIDFMVNLMDQIINIVKPKNI